VKFLKLMMIVEFTENNVRKISASPSARSSRKRIENLENHCNGDQQERCQTITCNLDLTKKAICSLNGLGCPKCECKCKRGYWSKNCGKQISVGQSLDQTITENGQLLVSA
jgi:hypothetical protein